MTRRIASILVLTAASLTSLSNSSIAAAADLLGIKKASHPFSLQPNTERIRGGDIDDSTPVMTPEKEKICIIGSGNWGSAICTVLARNAARQPFCADEVNMWVFEEQVTLPSGDTQNLSDIINTMHENVKYLPGVKLPSNVRAVPDLKEACKGATLLVFVLPHQFLPKLFDSIRSTVHPRCRGVSLIKGLDFDAKTKLPVLISRSIEKAMGGAFKCGVLMGKFSECCAWCSSIEHGL